jgi:hypothetical protein
MERLAAELARVDPHAERRDEAGWIAFQCEELRITVYPQFGTINVPCWFDGERALAAIDKARAYACVLRDVGGYTMYDPQTSRVVEEEMSGEEFAESYAPGREMARAIERGEHGNS